MNPLWAVFFKDRFKTPFSMYRMSFAEIVFLLSVIGACGYGVVEGVSWIINAEMGNTSVLDSTNN